MDDFDFGDRDSRSASEHGRQSGPLGGFSLQTGASVLLIAVIAAVLWLFLGPMPDAEQGIDLPTATATGQATSAARPQPGPAGTRTAPVVSGSPVAGTQAAAESPEGTPAAGSVQAQGSLRDGTFVEIWNTGGLGVRYRFGPGADYATISILQDGDVLKVIGTSETSEGLTWWRLQDDQGNVGWAAQEFLRPVAMPAGWSPPLASPTFPATGGLGDGTSTAP